MPLPPQAVLRDYRVASNRSIADGIFELALSPVNAEDCIPAPLAGQWVMLHLLQSDGSVWGKSAYSIANAPAEVAAEGTIVLAIRMRGAFTQRAKNLVTGDLVKIQGPFGVFTIKPRAARHVFFAGGIGISPLRCMIHQTLRDQPGTPMILFASMRTAREAAFLEEFRNLASSNPAFTFVPLFTREDDPSVEGERGHICENLIRRHLGAALDGEYYVCGPRPFMDEAIRILHDIGVEQARIHVERFG